MTIEKLYQAYNLISSKDIAVKMGIHHSTILKDVARIATRHEIIINNYDDMNLPQLQSENINPLEPVIFEQIGISKIKNFKPPREYHFNAIIAQMLEMKYNPSLFLEHLIKTQELIMQINHLKQEHDLLKLEQSKIPALTIMAPNGSIPLYGISHIITKNVYEVNDLEVIETLRENEFLEQDSLMPSKKALQEGLLELQTSNDHKNCGTLITMKGQEFLINYFLNIKKTLASIADKISFVANEENNNH